MRRMCGTFRLFVSHTQDKVIAFVCLHSSLFNCLPVFCNLKVCIFLWPGLRKGSADARPLSFLSILELIPSMLKPPGMLFVENVVGFEVC